MKKSLLLAGLISFIIYGQEIDPRLYTADVINKSQFPIYVRVYKPGAKKDEKPSAKHEYTTEWQLQPGVAKYNQKLGWKDQFTYTNVDLEFTVNYGGVNEGVKMKETYKIPKNLQNTNDMVITVEINKIEGPRGVEYLNRLTTLFYPDKPTTRFDYNHLNNQKAKNWAWVPKLTIQPK